MSLATWFKHLREPNSSKRLDDLLMSVALYLQGQSGTDNFYPRLVGKALSESEMAALTALWMLEKRGITKHHYGVYCSRKNVALEEYDSLESIPPSLPCSHCEEEHTADNDGWKIDLFFTVDRDRLIQFTSAAMAA